jgi:hypothetical protein
MYRSVWKELGGPARCPRPALGHPKLDPTLVKDESGAYYLRAVAEIVRGLYAPRKMLPTPGAFLPAIRISRAFIGALSVTINGHATFLDVDRRIDMRRFGPGRLEDEFGSTVEVREGCTVPLERTRYYFFCTILSALVALLCNSLGQWSTTSRLTRLWSIRPPSTTRCTSSR